MVMDTHMDTDMDLDMSTGSETDTDMDMVRDKEICYSTDHLLVKLHK
jgi:hypothetical protein